MKMCFNWKVVAGLSLVGLTVLALAPNLIGSALPLLVLAACPLSMILMMRAMSGGGRCASGPSKRPTESRSDGADSPDEMARLRAEIDQLRSERAGRADVSGEQTSTVN